MSRKFLGASRRAAAAFVRGAAAFLTWLLNLKAFVAVAIVLAIAYVFEFGRFSSAPPPLEQIRQTSDYCAQLGGYDDGATDDEQLAMAVAHVNLAKQRGQSTCDIYKSFGTLIGPGTRPWFAWFREPITMYSVSRLSADRKAAFNQAGLLLGRYLKDPTEDLKRFPWLSCVTHYIRTTWPLAVPRPDYTLRETMDRKWISSTGTEFFCPL